MSLLMQQKVNVKTKNSEIQSGILQESLGLKSCDVPFAIILFIPIHYLYQNKSKVCSQIYTRDTRPCATAIPAWGSIWGSSSFPVLNLIIVRQVRKLPACTVHVVWAWRQSCVKSRTACQDRERVCFAFAPACVVGKNRGPAN